MDSDEKIIVGIIAGVLVFVLASLWWKWAIYTECRDTEHSVLYCVKVAM